MLIKRAILSILGLTLLLLVVPVANADPPKTLNGNFETISREIHSFKVTDDGNTIISYTGTAEFTGDISGIFVALTTIIISPDGTFNIRAPGGLFTGSVDGKEGTLQVSVEVVGEGPSGPTNCCFEGMATFYQGTGDLEGVSLAGKVFNRPETGGTTYSLMAHVQ